MSLMDNSLGQPNKIVGHDCNNWRFIWCIPPKLGFALPNVGCRGFDGGIDNLFFGKSAS